MNNINFISSPTVKPTFPAVKPPVASSKAADNPALRKAFNEFVGQTFYGQLLKEMRKSQGHVAYCGGGQAEEIFTQQLDQELTKKMTAAGADKLSGPLYNLFTQGRR